ncbi:hypothetical protein J27TS8_19610 [Robertmurraya siralis]|uniref:Ureidoglycolate lyase n=1 Tax=Robertmurraya siralis TaxID=77777 RepID=A0A920BTH0_9BACI|nr:fumarylacetoacetate hydrolase family protein [Robertmurraya siralis]PAE18682.1 ureidoglycolate lyase [Bacillus sp. 7504-2]GIN61968.1 hypothetical protein J27TS8_19610 [Robertmurraya siralis]
MKFTRFTVDTIEYKGVLVEDGIREIKGNIFADWEYTGKVFSMDEVKLLAPLAPNQIIGIGANYVASPDERPNELPEIPVFFFKPISSVIGPEDEIIIPAGCDTVKFESELAAVIGRKAKNISEEQVFDYVFGYTVGNDVTAPAYFHETGHWTIGKSFDTFTPLGPFIETEIDPLSIRVKSRLNGEEKQNSGQELMIISTAKMISYLSHVMTLQPGDVILTGSPVGAEFVRAGDVIECDIEGIGILRNSFVKEAVSVDR